MTMSLRAAPSGRWRRAWPTRLRNQLALGMVAFVVLGFLLIYAGATSFDAHLARQQASRLSPEARGIYERARSGQMPTAAEAARVQAEAERINADLERQSLIGLCLLVSLAVVAGALLARALAGRLVEPVERVAGAARRLAEGDLSARAEAGAASNGESHQLVADFNRMADSLQASDRHLREVTAAIAHELRTPLTILRGRLQGVADGVFGSGPAEMRGLIGQVDSLSRIVDDLRVLTLASASRLELQCQPVQLVHEVEMLLKGLEPDLLADGLTVERRLQPVVVNGDAVRLRQALLCLLDNARRHARDGGIVCIETEPEASGAQAVLRVLDRGPGLPEAALSKLFEPFWRADESRSRMTGGSGLGLSVVQAIAQAHGGTVRASNRPGGGACFEIRLPVQR